MSKIHSLKVEKLTGHEELKRLIRKKEKDLKVLNRVYFINYLYNECSVPEASEKFGITKQTGYIWPERWNERGYEGLKPRFAGRIPSKIADQEKSQLKEILKEMNNWTNIEVKNLIHDKFKVEYSLKQVGIILRNLGMKFGKPYPHDCRRPTDAKGQLKKNVKQALAENPTETGFLDESSPQNTVRLKDYAHSPDPLQRKIQAL